MAARSGTLLRHIDIRALQRHLVDIGNLPESVLTDEDSHPLPAERVAEAVQTILDDYRSLAIILGHRDTSLPLLQQAYRTATGEKQIAYAKVLGMMGDATGLETLLEEVEQAKDWDEVPAWNSGGKDSPNPQRVGWSVSHVDNTLIALGRTRRPEAVPAVLNKLALLRPQTGFSHHRAVCLAAEWLGDPRAAQPLAELLQQPEMSGHAVTSIDQRATSARSRADGHARVDCSPAPCTAAAIGRAWASGRSANTPRTSAATSPATPKPSWPPANRPERSKMVPPTAMHREPPRRTRRPPR